jgi:hypothetical protein
MAEEHAQITNAELAAFAKQFASLVHAKVSLLDILNALREQSGNPLMREIVDSVRDDAEMGHTLATAFSRYPSVFSPFFISMIRQGELEGELDRVLADLAIHYESRVEDTVDTERRRDGAGMFDLEAVASMFRWILVWVTALVSVSLLGSGLIWYATGGRGLPGQPLPNMLLFTGVVLLLGVLVLARGRRKR